MDLAFFDVAFFDFEEEAFAGWLIDLERAVIAGGAILDSRI